MTAGRMSCPSRRHSKPYIIPGLSFGIIYDNTWEITVTDEHDEAENCNRSRHRH